MISHDAAARQLILAKLTQSRAELVALLDPPRTEQAADGEHSTSAADSQFPRSRTMKMLLSGRGVGTLGALAAGLLVARPALALRLLRMVPASSVAKMLLAKAVTSFGSRHD